MNLYLKEIKKVFARQGKTGGTFCALDTTTLTLTGGKLIEITGRSGSGKSTLLQIAGGLLRPSEGRVVLDDTELYTLEDGPLSRLRNRHIGVIPQGHTALRSLTVLENVTLPARLYDPLTDATERAKELLEMVGIEELADEEPMQLSGGESCGVWQSLAR